MWDERVLFTATHSDCYVLGSKLFVASHYHSEPQLPSASYFFHTFLQPFSPSLSFHWKLKALALTFEVVPWSCECNVQNMLPTVTAMFWGPSSLDSDASQLNEIIFSIDITKTCSCLLAKASHFPFFFDCYSWKLYASLTANRHTKEQSHPSWFLSRRTPDITGCRWKYCID